MKRIAQFEKVSLNEFKKEMIKFNYSEEEIEKMYNEIKLPKRATAGSAGYDFYSPFEVIVKANNEITIPSGIRVKIDNGWVLKCYPRSSMGFKFHMELSNTVGIIDSDYYNALNEGHIMFKIINGSIENKDMLICTNKAIIQGIFIEYGITYDDLTDEVRIGGFGSTNK